MRGESPRENVKRKSGERELRVEGDKEGRDFEGETEKKVLRGKMHWRSW